MPSTKINVPILSEEAAAAYEAYQEAVRKKRAADRLVARNTKRRDDAREAVLAEMGDFRLAQLPDGRLIVREHKSFAKDPLPATTVTWWELHDLQSD